MIKANITGAWYSSRNAGDQAILVAIRELLEARIPRLRFQVLCARDEFVHEEHGLPALSQDRALLRIFSDVFRSDLLLLGGGTPFYDNFKHMCYFWMLSMLCKAGGGKLAVYGASAQQLKTPSGRWFTRRIMNLADLVTVREDVTAEQLRGLGVTRPIHCTADPAITLAPSLPEEIDAILRAEGLAEMDRPLFAICPHFFSNTDTYRVHHYARFADDTIERQRETLARTATYLSGLGRVVFVPMNTDPPDSDLDAMQSIADALPGDATNITFIKRQYRPREIAGLLSRCKLVVGVRLHSLILAAAVETPIVGIDYAPKVRGFLRLLEHSEYGVDLAGSSGDMLVARIAELLAHYDSHKAAYVEKVHRLKKRAEENADMVAELLSSR